MNATPGQLVAVDNASGPANTLTGTSFFDNLVTGQAKGIQLPGGAGINPETLPAVKFYWDASDLIGVVSSGSAVTNEAVDRISGYQLTGQNVGGLPIFWTDASAPNGLGYVRFNSSGNKFSTNFPLSAWSGLNGIWAFIFVMRCPSANAGNYLGGWYYATTGDYVAVGISASRTILTDIIYASDTLEQQTFYPTPLPTPNTGFMLVTAYSDGTNVNIRLNSLATPGQQGAPNTLLPSITIPTTVDFSVGAAHFASSSDICAALVMDSTITLSNLQAVEIWLMNEFGFGPSQPLLANAQSTLLRQTVIMGPTSLNSQPGFVDSGSGEDAAPIWNIPATLTVGGPIRGDAGFLQNHLLTAYDVGAVEEIWEIGGSGFSAIAFITPGLNLLGCGTYGQGPAGGYFPWSAPGPGSTFVEGYNDSTGSYKTPDIRVVMTSSITTPTAQLRSNWRWDTYAIEDLDGSMASERTVNGPSAGLACLRGRPVTAVAGSGGTLNTNITTPGVGLVEVLDKTNNLCAQYRLEGTTLTAIGTLNSQWTTTINSSNKVNVYASAGQIVVQNETSGPLNITASFYG